jgi:enamine deaminase RidA (YjgF/YER057c/UK114 family)
MGRLLFVAGHGPKNVDGTYIRGRIAGPEDVARGYEAARLAALNMLASVKSAVGDLKEVGGVLKVLGMVNAHPDFTAHPQVIDGCSDLLVTAFGPDAVHARSAVGMGSLPHGMSVEVEAVFYLR